MLISISRRTGIFLSVAAILIWTFGLGCSGDRGLPDSDSTLRSAEVENRTQLTIAMVADYPASVLSETTELVDWLNERLADREIGIRVGRSVPEVAAWLESGEADFFVDSPYPVLLARYLSGCRPVLRHWKYGTSTYRSIIFTRSDSEVRELDDIAGRVLAFEDRYSSSSFFLPFGYLISKGFDGVFLKGVEDRVPTGKPGWVFSGGDSNTMHWVLAGKVAVGAMNEWSFHRYSGSEKTSLRIVAETEEIPRGLVAARKDLDPEDERKVIDLLSTANADPSGREMLQTFSSTDRFDSIPLDFMERLDELQAMVVQIDALVKQGKIAGVEAKP